MKNKRFYKLNKKAGKLINEKFPIHKQINHIADMLVDKDKNYSKFETYYNHTKNIREKHDVLEQQMKEMTDTELDAFDVNDKKNWE